MSVGDTQPTAIDEAGEPGLVGDQVGQAGIAMSDHQLFGTRSPGQELFEKIARRLALALRIEVRFIDRARRDAGAGVFQPALNSVIEGTGGGVELVQIAQRPRGDFDDLVGPQRRRRGEIATGKGGDQQPVPSRVVCLALDRRARDAAAREPSQPQRLAGQLFQRAGRFDLDEQGRAPGRLQSKDGGCRAADLLRRPGVVRQVGLPGARQVERDFGPRAQDGVLLGGRAQSRSRSLIEVLERVRSSTVFTITAQ